MTLRRGGGFRSGLRRTVAMLAALAALPAEAAASHLDGFVFTFEPGAANLDPWCTDMPPSGSCFLDGDPVTQFGTSSWSGTYLGPFVTESVSLQQMDYLQIVAVQTNRAYLSFDLLLNGVWGGNGLVPGEPDFESVFEVSANGRTILDTSFAIESNVPQAYPGTYPQGSYPGGTGSALNSVQQWFAVYHLDLMFDFSLLPIQCCSDVSITFTASFGPYYEENGFRLPTWGVDNVVVSSTPIPEPASGVLLGLGLAALGVRRASSRRAQSASGGASTRVPCRTSASLTATGTARPPLMSS